MSTRVAANKSARSATIPHGAENLESRAATLGCDEVGGRLRRALKLRERGSATIESGDPGLVSTGGIVVTFLATERRSDDDVSVTVVLHQLHAARLELIG